MATSGNTPSFFLKSDIDRILLQLKLRDQELEIIMLKEKLEEQMKINQEMAVKMQKLQETVLDYQEDYEKKFYTFSVNQHR
jgi:hypothetical protein